MLKVTAWVQHSIDSHPFRSMSIGQPIPEIQLFQNLTLEIQGQGERTLVLHNYGSRQFHITWNGINPSSAFSDMAQVLPHLTSFGPWASPCGANGQITMTRQVLKTLNGLQSSSGFRDLRSAKSGPNLYPM